MYNALIEELRAQAPTQIRIAEVRESENHIFVIRVTQYSMNVLSTQYEEWTAEGPHAPGADPPWSSPVLEVDAAAGELVVECTSEDYRPGDFDSLQLVEPDYQQALRRYAKEGAEEKWPLSEYFDALEKRRFLRQPATEDLEEYADVDFLRPAQQRAMVNAARPFSVVWGPPGTGKTYTLGCIAAAFSLIGRKVLIVAPTNVAADNAAISVDEARKRYGKRLRLGELIRPGRPRLQEMERRKHLMAWTDVLKRYAAIIEDHRGDIARLRQQRLDVSPETRSEANAVIAEVQATLKGTELERGQELWNLSTNASVIVTTLTSALSQSRLLDAFALDPAVLIVDESSMVPRVAIMPFCGAKPDHLVVCGDMNQLGTVRKNNNDSDENSRYWMAENLFDVSGSDDDAVRGRMEAAGCLTLLDQQSRMRVEICEPVSRRFYAGRLETINPPDPPPIVAEWPDACRLHVDPYTVDLPSIVPGDVRPKPDRNRWERSAWIDIGLADDFLRRSRHDTVLIITPFAKQKFLLMQLVSAHLSRFAERVEAGTVHTAQGREADLVIFDLVNPTSSWLMGQIPNDRSYLRMFCVAFSRARRQLVVVGDGKAMSRNPVIRDLTAGIEPWVPEWG